MAAIIIDANIIFLDDGAFLDNPSYLGSFPSFQGLYDDYLYVAPSGTPVELGDTTLTNVYSFANWREDTISGVPGQVFGAFIRASINLGEQNDILAGRAIAFSAGIQRLYGISLGTNLESGLEINMGPGNDSVLGRANTYGTLTGDPDADPNIAAGIVLASSRINTGNGADRVRGYADAFCKSVISGIILLGESLIDTRGPASGNPANDDNSNDIVEGAAILRLNPDAPERNDITSCYGIAVYNGTGSTHIQTGGGKDIVSGRAYKERLVNGNIELFETIGFGGDADVRIDLGTDDDELIGFGQLRANGGQGRDIFNLKSFKSTDFAVRLLDFNVNPSQRVTTEYLVQSAVYEAAAYISNFEVVQFSDGYYSLTLGGRQRLELLPYPRN